jgi:FkbM family methyltransferase
MCWSRSACHAPCPTFYGSLKVAITLAFVGTTVSEMTAANEGIGYLLISAGSAMQMGLAFAGLVVVGAMAMVMYELFSVIERHTTAWAHPIEAQERIYYALAGNIAINNCFNARAIHGAVGATVGSLDIPVPDYSLPASFGSLELRQTKNSEFIGQTINPDRNQKVSMLTIDSLALTRLDFIKIDIEGMEMEALEGGRATIEQHKPVMLIESIKTDKAALLKFLSEHGYKTYPMGINIMAVHHTDPTQQHVQANR